MDMLKFFKERKRMCDTNFNKIHHCSACDGYIEKMCAVDIDSNFNYDKQFIIDAIQIVEKWSQENPEKTILQDFLEKYPNAPLNEAGIPDDVCPFMLGYKKSKEKCVPDEYFCKKCWNRPLEE